MAFKKKTWKDRLVEYAGRRKITNVSTLAAQIVDMERAEGVVSEEGSAFSAANMNDFEQRVADGFSGVQQEIDGINSDLDECSFERREDGAYITYTPPGGADPVTKKLGSADIIYFGNSSKENAAEVLSYAFSSNIESCIAIISYCRDVAVNPQISISAPNRQISDTSNRFSGYNVYNRTMVYLLNNVVPGQRITVGDYGGKILTLLKVSN